MKKFLALILIIFSLTACGEENYEYLIGTWYWDGDGAYIQTFNEDGTGERGFPENMETFVWTTTGSRLNINRDHPRGIRGEIREERWNFSVEDGVLTIDSRQNSDRVYSYVFAAEHEHPENLLGAWHWDDNSDFLYTFNPDGSGTRGFPVSPEYITWFVIDSRLHIYSPNEEMGVRGEMWSFSIRNEALVLDSLQNEGTSFNYSRAS
ncbi:MAG: hypothetical protein FWF81_08380 [Defluviitaleaceae bacterium]|nr:hypothetical protein [Defluviitaleaceae bacterium]